MTDEEESFGSRLLARLEQFEQLESDREACLLLERCRWGDDLTEATCPKCEDADVYPMRNRQKDRGERPRWRCRACNGQFTVRTGTGLDATTLSYQVICRTLVRLRKEGPSRSAASDGERRVELAWQRILDEAESPPEVSSTAQPVARVRRPLVTGLVAVGLMLVAGLIGSRVARARTPLVSLEPSPLPDQLVFTWLSSGQEMMVTTDRSDGESDDQLRKRHSELLEAALAMWPPDKVE